MSIAHRLRDFVPGNKKKLIVILFILLISVYFGLMEINNQDQKTIYHTTVAKRGNLTLSIRASGSVSTGIIASVNTQMTGLVKEIYVSNGDYVKEGDKIAMLSLDTASRQKKTAAYTAYLTAKNNLDIAKNQMNALQADLFEANQTFVKGAGTINPIIDDPTYIIQKADWLKAESDYINQKNIITAAETALSSAWLSYKQLSDTITAPIPGYISNLNITNNSIIAGQTAIGQTIGYIKLKDAKPAVVVNLTEIDIIKVKIGQTATLIFDAFPDKTFTGEITAINTNGIVSSGVALYPVTINLDTLQDNIYPNMEVSAEIITNIKYDIIILPARAIQNQNKQFYVRVLKNGVIKSVPVQTGESSDTQTEIISGIGEGDTIILDLDTQSSKTSVQTSFPLGIFEGKQQLKIQVK